MLTTVRKPRRLPVVLSPEKVAHLLEAAPSPKYRPALSKSYGAGLRATEVVALKRVRQSAGNGPWPQFCAGSNACSFRHSE
jgi:site-specific recombinase XerD